VCGGSGAMTLGFRSPARGADPVTTTVTKPYQDTQVDVKHVLCALWTVMLFVFAYVDIFGLYRADVLDAALDGKMASTPFTVDQMFLTLTLVYILPPILMVAVTLLARPRVNRTVNIIVSPLYMISIIASCVGETWVYYYVGSLIEVLLLAAIARVAWKWPPPNTSTSQP
jgi:hypothetical protein